MANKMQRRKKIKNLATSTMPPRREWAAAGILIARAKQKREFAAKQARSNVPETVTRQGVAIPAALERFIQSRGSDAV